MIRNIIPMSEKYTNQIDRMTKLTISLKYTNLTERK